MYLVVLEALFVARHRGPARDGVLLREFVGYSDGVLFWGSQRESVLYVCQALGAAGSALFVVVRVRSLLRISVLRMIMMLMIIQRGVSPVVSPVVEDVDGSSAGGVRGVFFLVVLYQ